MSGQGRFERRIGRRAFIFNAAAGAVAVSGAVSPVAWASGDTGRVGERAQRRAPAADQRHPER